MKLALISSGIALMAEQIGRVALQNSQSIPLLPETELATFGATVVFAPHPDDESLGCGGLIALLTRLGLPVRVVIMSDGVGSHRNSEMFPEERLRELRQQEAIAAVETLGVRQANLAFLDLPDEHVPYSGSEGFGEAVDASVAAMTIDDFSPETVVLPWRRDPHCDHESTWQIVQAALQTFDRPFRVFEYTIWLAEIGDEHHWPRIDEVQPWRLDISSVLDQKRAAIACHRSQTTDLIDDDPAGFRLSPDTLARFETPWEIYLEPSDD
jgi:LmbE family N-acetylglucosaminyl deacetylase